MAIVLELLSGKHQTIKYFKFDKSEISIGRDHHCDLRLNDPYVCSEHLRISQETDNAVLKFQDCHSINGTEVNGQLAQVGELYGDDVLKLGRTRLRVINSSQAVAATLSLSRLEEDLSWLSSSALAIGLTIGYLVLLMVSSFISSADEYKLATMMPKEMGQIALLSVWPLLFAVMGKVFKKESRVVSQFNIMWIFLFVLYGLYLLQKILSFNLNGIQSLIWIEFVVFSTLLFAFIWFSLFIAFHQTNKRRNILTCSLSLLLLLPILSMALLDSDEFSPRPEYDTTLLPPLYQILPVKEVSALLDDSAELFVDVQQQLAEEQSADD
ncbi:MAG: hypothetical protein ACI9J5_003528 [Paraglaciecola sp.]|jgi:hypothetical protein